MTTTEQAPIQTRPDTVSNFIDSLSTEAQAFSPKAEGLTPPPTPEPPKPNPEPSKPDEKAKQPEPVKETEPQNEDGQDKWPRSAKDWEARKSKQAERQKAIEAERDAIKAERDAVKAEIETLKKQGPSPELEALKKERDELSDRLRLVAVTEHPKFKAYFENKTNAQIELAKRTVGTERAARVEEILKMAPSEHRDMQLEEFAADLTDFKRSQLGSVVMALSQIQQERETEVTKARDNYKAMSESQEKAQTEARQKIQQQSEKSFNDKVNLAQDAKGGLFVFQKRDGDTEWNKGVDNRIEEAKRLMFGQGTPDLIAEAALRAVSLPVVLQTLIKRDEELSGLREQIKALSASAPTVKSGEQPKATPPSTTVQTNRNGAHLRPMDASASFMQSIQSELNQ